jgi:uncharacterized protein YjdB
MKKHVHRPAAALAALALPLFFACSGSGDRPVTVTGVELDRAALPLLTGGAGSLTAYVVPSGATNKNVTWVSSTPSVADISGDGPTVTVNAVSPGESTITVTTQDGGRTAKCVVTVTASVAVTGVTLSQAYLTPAVGGAATLTATVAPAGATNKNVTWASSATGVATISGSGPTVTINAAALGKSTITVTTEDGGKAAACAVTVLPPGAQVASVAMGRVAMRLNPMGAGTLTAAVLPADAVGQDLEWTSSNAGVASVAGGGLSATVTGVARGTAVIRATAPNGRSATCAVTVAEPQGPGVFVAGNFGLLKDGAFAMRDAYMRAVHVDARNNVHATGTDSDGRAVYVWNGMAAVLPSDQWATGEAGGYGMHVTGDDHVYIAGYQSDGSKLQPRLWVDGAGVPLGSSDYAYLYAPSVCVHGGDVYVLGVFSANPWFLGAGAVVWRNGALHSFAPAYSDIAESIAVAAAGTVYVGGNYGLIAIDAFANNKTVSYSRVLDAGGRPNYWHINSLHIVGGDVHAAGWQDESAVYYDVGRNKHVLPRDAERNYAEASCVSVSENGDVYIAGFDHAGGSDRLAMLWVNGVPESLAAPNAADGYSSALSVSVGGVAAPNVPVTGVTLSPGQLSLPYQWYGTGTVTATVSPGNATSQGLTWSSSNQDVAFVTETGSTATVTILARGTTTITAMAFNGVTGTCSVTVN